MSRAQFGAALIHLAVDSKHVEARRTTLQTIQSLATRFPEITNHIIRDALLHRLTSKQEDETSLQSRFNATLSASLGLSEEMDLNLREEELGKNLILAHHSAVC